MKKINRGDDASLDRTVDNLVSITDEYVEWSDKERERLARRFHIVVGMFGEGKKSRRRAPCN